MELLQQIYTTQGRLNRLRYFKYQIIWSLLVGIAGGILAFLGEFVTGDSNSVLVTVPTGIMSFFGGIGNIMLGVRRLHDLDKSGLFMLLMLIPLVNLIFLLYLWLAPGTYGYNRYGEDPLTY